MKIIIKIQSLGKQGLEFIKSLGQSGVLLSRVLFGKFRYGSLSELLIKQFYSVGVLSLVIILVSGFFIGMVLGLQGYTILLRYGSTQAVGQLVALSLIRELGPVVSALLFAGRAGTSLTSEIGVMKATEQLNSMEMFGVDPFKRIIAPRFWAGVISLPLLSCIFIVTGVLGSSMIAVNWLGVDSGSYWVTMQTAVDFKSDVLGGLLKSFVFAFVITWISVYQGYYSKSTSDGIGLATTKTVVHSSLAVLGMDFILTALMFGGN